MDDKKQYAVISSGGNKLATGKAEALDKAARVLGGSLAESSKRKGREFVEGKAEIPASGVTLYNSADTMSAKIYPLD